MPVLEAIALRPGKLEPMQLVESAELDPARGIVGDYASEGERQVTLISAELWQRAMSDLGADLPWHTRRANLLIQGLDFADLVGRKIRIGDAELQVHGVTHPCSLMDQFHAGLREALDSELRCGVYGKVESGGTLEIGSPVEVVDSR